MALTRKLLTLALMSSFAAGLSAQTTATADQPVKEKKICRKQEQTGSIMLHTKCGTKQEWAEYDDANRRGAAHALGVDGAPGGISPEKDK